MEEDTGLGGYPDPWYWSIDDVVSYLCHGSFDSWAGSQPPPPRPDPTFLEKILRENDITGKILLTEVNRNTLVQDFGIKSLGQRATIFEAIQHLQRSSTKCKESEYQLVAPSPSAVASFGTPGPVYNHFGSPWPQQSPAAAIPAGPPSTPAVLPRKAICPPPKRQSAGTREEISSELPASQPPPDSPTGPTNRRQNEHVVVGSDGKKRRKLTLAATDTPVEQRSQASRRQDGDWYLGPGKLASPDVFYKDIESDDDNFSLARPTKIPTGRRLFVKQRMQHYLQQPLTQVTKDGKQAYARFPYDSRAGQDPNAPHYFTLFARNEEGTVDATKEDYSHWREQDSTDNFNALLKKYPPNEEQEDHTILPLYGESASEDGYDSDTWQEMQEEAGERQKTLRPAEVDEIIDACITGYVEAWQAKHWPVEERKAAKLWVRSRKTKTKNRDVKSATAQIAHLEYRLRKLRQAIKECQLTKIADVKQQCQSLERTVFAIEHQKWRISVLELEKCPQMPKEPLKKRKTQRRPQPVADEESLGSDSPSNSSDDDFIVPDDIHEDSGRAEVPEMPIAQPDSETDATPSKKLKSSQAVREKRSSLDIAAAHTPPSSSRLISDVNLVPLPERVRKQRHHSAQAVEVVDLTKTDDEDVDGDHAVPSNNDNAFGVRTPPLNPVSEKNDSDPSRLANNKNKGSSLIEHGSKSSLSNPRDDIDIDEIMRTKWPRLEELLDRKGLLIKQVFSLPREELEAVRKLFRSLPRKKWRKQTRRALHALSNGKKKIPDLGSDDSELYMRMASWYISYLKCERLLVKGIRKQYIDDALDKKNHKEMLKFYPELADTLRRSYDPPQQSETGRHVSLTASEKSHKSQILIDGSDYDSTDGDHLLQEFLRMPNKKRKRPVKQSQEAMDTQQSAQRRVEKQEQQQRRLVDKLESMGVANSDPERQAVSFDDPVINLHPHIGGRVKAHQLNGIQFMWRELIKDEKHQGCLLAHTMGLGKTMQVISLLVTIANAANSSDPQVRNQVPKALRRSRTLVLCPSSLIDNWFEEFLMWVPPDDAVTQQNLRQLRKIQPTLSPSQRLQEVSAWYEDGGVLLISYDIFRAAVMNRATKSRDPALAPDVHEKVKKQLLEGPNIIVADEAHKMKNRDSAIAEACKMFRSKSRIALTGSPLANHLTDYFSMIDWIAPKYLGDFVQFKAKYVEPIEAGLYAESMEVERRDSLKKLQVLKKDLDPKVNRHDISALDGSLPTKVEFVITVTLTDLQEQLYKSYIAALQDDKGEAKNTRIWHWLAILSLICNHPACFRDKILQKNDDPKKTQRLLADSDSDNVPAEEAPVSEILSQDVITEFKELFEKVQEIESTRLSHRARILEEIIDESIRVGDKILVFSHSLPTLDFIERLLIRSNRKYCRLDGKTAIGTRQASTKSFNQGSSDKQVYLISTRAGGLGLNLPGANRVILFDFQFNPTWEEQAVGRAYRLGQTKPVFVYRFLAGGTFEDVMHNKAVYKTQLSFRVVDKKNPVRWASKNQREYLFPPKPVGQEDLSEFKEKDAVLDTILGKEQHIRKIELTETFQREDNDKLTDQEEKDVQAELEDEQLKRNNPAEWTKRNLEREKAAAANRSRYSNWQGVTPSYLASQQVPSLARPQLLVPPPHGQPQPHLATQQMQPPASTTPPTVSHSQPSFSMGPAHLASGNPGNNSAPPPSSAPNAANLGGEQAISSIGLSRRSLGGSLDGNPPPSSAPYDIARKAGDPLHPTSVGDKQRPPAAGRQQEETAQAQDSDVEMTNTDKTPTPAGETEPI